MEEIKSFNKEYQNQLQAFLNTHYLEQAFINYFGEENKEQIIARLHDIEIICFQLNSKKRKLLKLQNTNKEIYFQSEFFFSFFLMLNISIEKESLKQEIEEQNYQSYLFQRCFHSSFFSSFSIEEFRKSPVFSFDIWSLKEQEQFLHTFYPLQHKDVSSLILKKGLFNIQQNFNYFHELLNQIVRYRNTNKHPD